MFRQQKRPFGFNLDDLKILSLAVEEQARGMLIGPIVLETLLMGFAVQSMRMHSHNLHRKLVAADFVSVAESGNKYGKKKVFLAKSF